MLLMVEERGAPTALDGGESEPVPSTRAHEESMRAEPAHEPADGSERKAQCLGDLRSRPFLVLGCEQVEDAERSVQRLEPVHRLVDARCAGATSA